MIKLVQLPIPEVHELYNAGNIPLAAGYLKTFALSTGAVTAEKISIVPRRNANFGGDAAIIENILGDGKSLSVVGFTCYMWNIERSIFLAKKIKEKSPGTLIVFGGPEMTGGHWLEGDGKAVIDVAVQGEGEAAFVRFIRDLENGCAVRPVYCDQSPLDLGTLDNPYLENVLIPVDKESLFIETMRGCPYPCKYCFYSKSYSGMRFFPEEHLPRLFSLAREKKVPELYIMDPSFNVTPGLKKRLETLAELNSSRIPMHTEMRLESVTPQLALLMENAGFASVEAGLQSVNEKSLKLISRDWNREKFIRGARLLRERQIDVKTGVILGLPEDGLDEFDQTLDFVLDLELEESMEIYPLSMIPGTALREEADVLGLKYMPHPPYWVTENKYMNEKDFKAAIEMVEQKLEIEFFPPIVPRFHNPYPGFIHFIDLRENHLHQLDELYENFGKIGHNLTLLLDPQTPLNGLLKLGEWLENNSPYTLVQMVLDWDDIPPKPLINKLTNAFFRPSHYFNRIHHFKIDIQDMYSLRFFHLTNDLALIDRYLYEPLFCDVIVKYIPGLITQAGDILEEKPVLWVEHPIDNREWEELVQIYADFENLCIGPPVCRSTNM